MAIEAGAQSDREIRAVLLARLPDAHKLASWILHDPIAAEDAVQEAALLAWGRRRTLRDPATAEAWFNRILVNVCRSELRRRSRRPLVTEVEPTMSSSKPVRVASGATSTVSMVPRACCLPRRANGSAFEVQRFACRVPQALGIPIAVRARTGSCHSTS
jgi:hypothetical protein